MAKKQEIYLYIALVVGVIALSSLVTVYVSSDLPFGTEMPGGREAVRPPLDVFAGHDVCIKAIHKNANGKVISLTSDDRSARYQGYNDSNQITFVAEVQPPDRPFLSEQRSTVRVFFRCSTSAKTNKLLTLSQQTNDIHGINQ